MAQWSFGEQLDGRPLAEQHDPNIALAKTDRHLAATTYPEMLDKLMLRPCVVRILMVTDGGGSFDGNDFGLAELLEVLAVSPGPWVRFAVTTAHRRSHPSAMLQNFRFSASTLKGVDEVWLFGVEGGASSLSEAELKAISQFMDAGGGVFATGDHEDLGVAMSGRVPRVRSMRKWYWPNPGPNGEPVAPDGSSQNRYDTLREGADAGFQFDDQSDALAQEITPRMYPVGHPFLHIKVPHPLLCGPRGPIRVLPDHPHEGECYVPKDLNRTFTFDGYTIVEYPAPRAGKRPRPEVIAESTVIGGHTTSSKPPVVARRFGAMGAYDGHWVKVGRVAVDATWHHFFNINLRGDPSSPVPAKRNGFHDASADPQVYNAIKAYFRNLAVWLAPRALQASMRRRAMWACRWKYPLLEELPSAPQLTQAKVGQAKVRAVGQVTREALERLAPRCFVIQWCVDLLREASGSPLSAELERLDPWSPESQQDEEAPEIPASPVLAEEDLEGILNTVLGGAMLSLASAFPERQAVTDGTVDAVLDKPLAIGAQAGIESARELLERSVDAPRLSLEEMQPSAQ
ncbi:hypothetical protein [Hyalangium versicolor]|uniref:hypothetical protein n=1 Tax=Hyalangium versicolor TaxID=2861190 RepID=UPI001CCB86BD|nr:hypothetical protein [Hyalangium versicolor]